MSSDTLHLGGSDAITYHLHPVVVLSILDHFKRRDENMNSVVGTLLGTRVGNGVDGSNRFPVPHVEPSDANDHTPAIDTEYHSNMLALQQRLNPDETVVGWYTTVDKISYTSYLLHEHYSKQCQNPLMLTIDVGLTGSRMAVRGYNSRTVTRDDPLVSERFQSYNVSGYDEANSDDKVAECFSHARLHYFTHEPERVGVDAMIKSAPDCGGLDAPATLRSDLNSLEMSLRELQTSMQTLLQYVRSVQRGDIKGDPALGRQIANALAQVPRLSAEVAHDNIQDLLMVVYLAKLTRTQAALTDNINYSLR
jgi:translation initiation factor 3 subunit F